MNLVSILGLLALLGLAWAMSYHPREVKLRPVVWGIGLQLVLALIILRHDYWSFVGMSILALMIVVYLLDKPSEGNRSDWRRASTVLVGAVVAGALLLVAAIGFAGYQGRIIEKFAGGPL